MVSQSGLRSCVKALERTGVEVNALLEAAGISPAAVDDTGAHTPVENIRRLWALAAEQLGDPAIGLHAASRVTYSDLGALGYLFRSASTVGEGLRRAIRAIQLLHDVGDWALFEDGKTVRLRIIFKPGLTVDCAHTEDFILASWLTQIREATGRDEIRPLHVRLQHALPLDEEPYRRVFGAPLETGALSSELVFSSAVLELPLPTDDPMLLRILAKICDQQLAQLPRFLGHADRICAVLINRLETGEDVHIEAVARRLGLSPRSLQRQLQQEGESFRGLLHKVRRDLARRMLCDSHRDVEEVADRLGFCDATAFHRAFLRWTGTSPARFRSKSGQDQTLSLH